MRKKMTFACAVMLTAGMAWGQETVEHADLYIRFNLVPEGSELLTGAQGSWDGEAKEADPKAIVFEQGQPTDAYLMDDPVDTLGIYTKTFTLPAGQYEYQVVYADGTGTLGSSFTTWATGRAFTVEEEKEVVFRAKVVDGYIKYLCDAQDLYYSPDSGTKNGRLFSEPDEAGLVKCFYTRTGAYKIGKVEGFIYPGISTDLIADLLPATKKYTFSGGSNGNVRWMFSYNRHTLECFPLQIVVCVLDHDSIGINAEELASAENLPAHAGTFTNAQPLLLSGGTNSVSARIGSEYNGEIGGCEKQNSKTLTLTPEEVDVTLHYNVYNADSTELVAQANSVLATATEPETAVYEMTWASIEPLNVTAGLADGDYTLNVWYESVCYGDTIRSVVYATGFTVEGNNSPTTGLDVPALQAHVTTQGQTICAAFDGTATVKLYALNGQLLDSRVAAGEYTYTASAGLYLLEVDGMTYKVAIR